MFDYEPALVTLFYEEGSQSRFIRQKVMLNLAPVEAYCKEHPEVQDVRLDPFCYTYMYGVLVHKLAHFFDIVHGTRHDFFMTEYRINFALAWIELLERKGFDPDKVSKMTNGPHHLWNCVF